MNNETYKEDDCLKYNILVDMDDDEQEEFIETAGFDLSDSGF